MMPKTTKKRRVSSKGAFAQARVPSVACTVQASHMALTPGLGFGPNQRVVHDLPPLMGKTTPAERLQRSRERNRMHARKTRQRKKEHVQNLQNRATELKQEQLRLRQLINEKNTASILVGLLAKDDPQKDGTGVDPRVEELLRRPAESIPDSAKVSELPALHLPGGGKKSKKSGKSKQQTCLVVELPPKVQPPDDGIDYALLGKDRSKCTPAELDQIRRERNRMHAKRTRDRKRLFMEEMEGIIESLQEENLLLQKHLASLEGDGTPALASPTLQPTTGTEETVKSLLLAAGAFENSAGIMASAVSEHSSVADQDERRSPSPKRRRLDDLPGSTSSGIPSAISV